MANTCLAVDLSKIQWADLSLQAGKSQTHMCTEVVAEVAAECAAILQRDKPCGPCDASCSSGVDVRVMHLNLFQYCCTVADFLVFV